MNYYNEIKNELINNEINRTVKNYSINRSDLNSYYNVGKILNEAGKHYGEGIIKEYSQKLKYDLNKNFIREWESLAEIQKECGYSTPNIIKCCNGDINSAYGYIWSKYELNKRVV